MRNKNFFLFALILLWQAAFADEKKEAASQWRGAEIKVDGADSEWPEAISYLEKEKFGFGLKNDSSDLYLCLKFDRQIQRQALTFGFTVWFDPAGKNKKVFGVRFPIGMTNYDNEAIPDPMQRPEEGGAMPPQFEAMLREVEVIGPEKDDRNRFAAGSSFGIQAATFNSPEGLVCELRIPLQSAPARPYAVAASAGQALSVGLELGELDREKMRERMGRGGGGFGGRPGGGFPPGGGMPRGGGRPGGFPGEMPPDRDRRMNAFKVWLHVTLAAGASTSSQGSLMRNDLDHLRVSLEAKPLSLRDALQHVVSQTNLQIVYSDALVKDAQTHYSGQNVTARAALDSLLAPAALDYRVMEDDQIVIIRRVMRKH